MRLRTSSAFRVRRALALASALAANLLAAGVPALHALAHHHDYGHHAPASDETALNGRHDEAHPESLHDDWIFLERFGSDFGAVVASVSDVSVVPVDVELVLPKASLPIASRAPPDHAVARAPPLA